MTRSTRIAVLLVSGGLVVGAMVAYSELFRHRDDVPHTDFGGVPAYVAGEGSATVIILHGFSGMPGDWAGVAAEMTERLPVRVVVPRGEHRARGRGWAWFQWPREAGGRNGWIRSIHEGRARVNQVIAHARSTGAEKVILVGHSMGARMAGDVGLSAQPPLEGLAFLAGSRLPTWSRAHVAQQRVFIWHGRNDHVLSFETAEETRDFLQGDGAQVTWLGNDAGHDFNPQAFVALLDFMEQVLSDSP